jgi:hypothetical protein
LRASCSTASPPSRPGRGEGSKLRHGAWLRDSDGPTAGERYGWGHSQQKRQEIAARVQSLAVAAAPGALMFGNGPDTVRRAREVLDEIGIRPTDMP